MVASARLTTLWCASRQGQSRGARFPSPPKKQNKNLLSRESLEYAGTGFYGLLNLHVEKKKKKKKHTHLIE